MPVRRTFLPVGTLANVVCSVKLVLVLPLVPLLLRPRRPKPAARRLLPPHPFQRRHPQHPSRTLVLLLANPNSLE